MALSIRDRNIFNTTVDLDLLEQLAEIRTERTNQIEALLPEGSEMHIDNTIRYEGIGLTGLQTNQLFSRFRNAPEVERVVMSADCPQSLKTNRMFGFVIDIRFDSLLPENNLLRVSGPDHDWVERTYTELYNSIRQNKNFHGHVKSAWFILLIQIFAVISMFSVSFWLGQKFSEYFKFENSDIIIFVFLLLIFSNIWTPVSQSIIKNLNLYFPNALFINRINQRKVTIFRTIATGVVTSIIFASIANIVSLVLSKLPVAFN